MGMELSFESSREIMDEIAANVSDFAGINYERMDEENGVSITGTTKEEVSA